VGSHTNTKRNVRNLVLLRAEYYIDRDKLQEYAKWAKDEVLPYWLSVPGVKEVRGYREQGSTLVFFEIDFESFAAYGKMADDPKYKAISTKAAAYTSGYKMSLWDVSPVLPGPLRPSK
jgi:hypothetical protein